MTSVSSVVKRFWVQVQMKADILTIFPGFFADRWTTELPAGPVKWAW